MWGGPTNLTLKPPLCPHLSARCNQGSLDRVRLEYLRHSRPPFPLHRRRPVDPGPRLPPPRRRRRPRLCRSENDAGVLPHRGGDRSELGGSAGDGGGGSGGEPLAQREEGEIDIQCTVEFEFYRQGCIGGGGGEGGGGVRDGTGEIYRSLQFSILYKVYLCVFRFGYAVLFLSLSLFLFPPSGPTSRYFRPSLLNNVR